MKEGKTTGKKEILAPQLLTITNPIRLSPSKEKQNTIPVVIKVTELL